MSRGSSWCAAREERCTASSVVFWFEFYSFLLSLSLMAARPLVSVYSGTDGSVVETTALPGVFLSPVRLDVVQHVHRDISKNKRQAYAVSPYAGHQTSAESWGTGRAVARIPRVPGGGTHRAGQGAFGNMCRGGRMFAPTKTYRRWHRKVNKNQRRFAIVSALAASGSVPLVLSRGHRIEQIAEIPLVISDATITTIEKTKVAVQFLKRLKAYEDVEKVIDSRKIRRGKGKARNRRYVQRRGPLIIYNQKAPLTYAFRNIPGVELLSVTRLNLLLLAPGGHLGRFIIWTKSAFERLDSLYGTYRKSSAEKIDYRLPRSVMTNSDLVRIINSDEVQTKLRPIRRKIHRAPLKKNPLRNLGVMLKLNPYAKVQRRQELKNAEARRKKKALLKENKTKKLPLPPVSPAQKAKQERLRKIRKIRAKWYKALLA